MAKKVKHSDLFENGIFEKDLPAIEAQIEALNLLEEKYKNVLKASAKIDAKNVKSKKAIDEFTKATKESRDAVEGLQVVEKQKIKAQKKIIELTDKELKSKISLQRANKERRDGLKAEIVLNDKLAGTEEKLLAKNTKLRLSRKKLNLETRKGRIALKQINRELNKNNKLIDLNSDKHKRNKRNVGNYGDALRGLTGTLAAVGLTAGIGSIVSNISGIVTGFEQGGANLASVLGKTSDQIKELTKDAKRLGSVTAFTAREILGLQTEFAKLGFSENEILDATEATLALAAATGTELSEAAAVAGATLGGLGLEASDTQQIVDVMAKAFSTSALDMEKFKESMKTAAPAARAVGISVEKTTALLGTLANAGISGSKAGNNLKTSLINLNKAGLTLEEGLLKVANSSDKLGAATKLVGKNAAASFLVLAEGTEETAKLQKGLENAGGAAETMANTQLDTLTGRTKLMTSAWEGFILSLEDGEGVFAQVANTVIEGITNMLNKMADLGKSAGALQSELTSERMSISQGHVNDRLQEQLELFEKSNEELKELSINGNKRAKTELDHRKLLLSENQKIITTQGTSAVFHQAELIRLKHELALREKNGEIIGNVELRREIDFVKGFRDAEKKAFQNKLRIATEKELIELAEKQKIVGEENWTQNIAIAAAAGRELQRRKDIGKIEEKTLKTVSDRIKKNKEVLKINKDLENIEDAFFLRSLDEENKKLVLRQQQFDKEFAQAKGNKQLQLDLEREFLNDIALIEEEFRNKRDAVKEKEERERQRKAEADAKIKADQKKKDEDDQLKREKDAVIKRAKFLEEAADALNEVLRRKTDERLELIDKEIAANEAQQLTLQELAAKGVINADENLAFEKKRAAELALIKQKEIEKAARQELALTAIKTYSGYVQAGEKGAAALARTVTDISLLKNLISTLDFFYEGTENTGTANNSIDSNGGRLAVLHDNERVMTAEQNKLVSGLSNWELANLGADYKNGENSTNAAIVSQRFQSNEAILNKFESLESAVKNIDMPEVNFHYDSIKNAFIKTVESHGKIERTIYKKSKLF